MTIKLNNMQTSGYSGTPLVKKLGFKEGDKIRVVNAPDYYFELLDGLPKTITIAADKKIKKDFVHYFAKEAKVLEKDIAALREEIVADGTIWISWAKKASKVATDITEDVIRHLALTNGLVDVKVCAIDEVWSGLKLVIPLANRKK